MYMKHLLKQMPSKQTATLTIVFKFSTNHKRKESFHVTTLVSDFGLGLNVNSVLIACGLLQSLDGINSRSYRSSAPEQNSLK